jgi:hypothetical protein
MWGQILMKDLLGGPMSAAKLSQATASAGPLDFGSSGVNRHICSAGAHPGGSEGENGSGLGK